MRIFLCLFLAAFSASAQRFDVKGDVKSLRSGSYVFLAYLSKGALRVDSAEVRDGKFQLKGKVEYPTKGVLLTKNPSRFLEGDENVTLYLEPRAFTVQSPDSLSHLTIIGSPLNDEHLMLNQSVEESVDAVEKLDREFRVSPATQQKDSVSVRKYLAQRAHLKQEAKAVYVFFAESHPQSYLSVISLESVIKDLDDEPALRDRAKLAFQRIKPDWKEIPQAYNVQQYLNDPQKDKLGKMALDFRQRTQEGTKISLADFRGKWVLLDFWASWCKPCRMESKYLVSVYEKYKDKGFTILSVSLDNDKQAWKQAIEADGLTWPQVSDLRGWQNEAALDYGIRSIPANFLINADGKVVASGLRGPMLEARLRTLLKDRK